MGWRLDLMILEVFFNLSGSMILWEGPEKGHKGDQMAGKCAIWGKAERIGFVQSWEKKA